MLNISHNSGDQVESIYHAGPLVDDKVTSIALHYPEMRWNMYMQHIHAGI